MATKCGLVAAGMIFLAVGVCRAQVPGDWNADGFVTAADAQGLSQCMTGPSSSQAGSCLTLSMDGEHVDLRSALALQNSQAPASPCQLSRAHVSALWHYQSIYGAQAEIEYLVPALCDQGTSTALAFSVAYVGFVDEREGSLSPDRTPYRWAFVGYTVHRSNHVDPQSVATPELQVRKHVFTEFSDGWQFWVAGPHGDSYQRRFWREPIVSPTQTYWAQISNPTTCEITFYVLFGGPGNDIIHSYAGNGGWSARTASRADFSSEVATIGDRLVGTVENHCQFSSCSYEAGAPFNHTDTEFQQSSTKNTAELRYGVSALGTALEVWDKRP